MVAAHPFPGVRRGALVCGAGGVGYPWPIRGPRGPAPRTRPVIAMLLTLSAHALRSLISGDAPKVPLVELPSFVMREFELHGLHVSTDMFRGWSLERIDRLRDQADKVGCPCLLLHERTPQPIGADDIDAAEAALDRMERVLRVAHRLGCSGVAMALDDAGAGEDELEDIGDGLRDVVQRAERLELNLLVAPGEGITSTPEQLTGLIRKVGGFRIGSFPSFLRAAASGDIAGYLRGVTPYASAVSAATGPFDASGAHDAFDLAECIEAIRAVGYEGTLALEPNTEGGDPVAQVHACKAALEELLEAAKQKK